MLKIFKNLMLQAQRCAVHCANPLGFMQKNFAQTLERVLFNLPLCAPNSLLSPL